MTAASNVILGSWVAQWSSGPAVPSCATLPRIAGLDPGFSPHCDLWFNNTPLVLIGFTKVVKVCDLHNFQHSSHIMLTHLDLTTFLVVISSLVDQMWICDFGSVSSTKYTADEDSCYCSMNCMAFRNASGQLCSAAGVHHAGLENVLWLHRVLGSGPHDPGVVGILHARLAPPHYGNISIRCLLTLYMVVSMNSGLHVIKE